MQRRKLIVVPGQRLPGRGRGQHERIRLQHGGASVEGRRTSGMKTVGSEHWTRRHGGMAGMMEPFPLSFFLLWI